MKYVAAFYYQFLCTIIIVIITINNINPIQEYLTKITFALRTIKDKKYLIFDDYSSRSSEYFLIFIIVQSCSRDSRSLF
jgi:hypothetical protein